MNFKVWIKVALALVLSCVFMAIVIRGYLFLSCGRYACETRLYEGPERPLSEVVRVRLGSNVKRTLGPLGESRRIFIDGKYFGSDDSVIVLPGKHSLSFGIACHQYIEPRTFLLFFDDEFTAAGGDIVVYAGVEDPNRGTRSIGFAGCSDWNYVHTVTNAVGAITGGSDSIGHWRP